jgi:ATP-dependent exoDNAse (exonuclease V) beta subunit
MVSSIVDKLKCFNDQNFKFDPKYHKYTYGGKQYTSVTKFISNFHKPFEQDYWSQKKADEAGVPQEWILKEWKDKNDRANFVGHSTHEWIENYFKGHHQQLPNDLDIIDRINKFNIIFGKQLYKLTPITFELRIFSKKYPLAGTIDSIFLYKGKLFIVDWKSNSEFKTDDHKSGRYNKLLSPFEDLYQNHLNEYSIQVSLYSLILREWGFNIRGSYLVHIGPSQEAIIHKAVNLVDTLDNYLKDYNWK